jgi:hypothetical protein
MTFPRLIHGTSAEPKRIAVGQLPKTTAAFQGKRCLRSAVAHKNAVCAAPNWQ